MNSQPIISIVLCTYNNADSLVKTLNQIACQSLADNATIEVILVDNSSPDQTSAVCRPIIEKSPVKMHYHFEGRQGLSYARNTGVEHASGQYILFTDDDAEIPDTWVAGYLNKIETLSPDCLYSKINIIWDRPIPWWYTNRFRPYFVGLDYGHQDVEVTDISKEFFGKNFCLKRDLIAALGGFDPALGRSGTRLIAGEETLIYRRLIQQQKKVIYFPDSPVGHRLKEREYTEENITKQFIDSAYSSYHIAKLTARKKLLGRPLGVLLDNLKFLLQSVAKIPLCWLSGDKQDLFFHKINLNRSLMLLKLWLVSK